MTSTPSRAPGPTPRFRVRLATIEDLDGVLAIHKECFTPETHALMHLGDDFLRTTYRWLITSPIAFTVVVEEGKELAGFYAATDRPYRAALFRDNLGALVWALVQRPGIIRKANVADSVKALFRRKDRRKDPDPTVPAQTVLMGVTEKYRKGFEVASMLLREVIEQGRKRGWKRIVGGAYKSNTAILFLCRLHGFKRMEHLDTELRCYVEYRYKD